jgi:hypothetical protein
MLHTYREADITFLRSPVLDRIPGVVHAFSTRRARGSDLDLGGDGTDAGNRREQFMAAIGLPAWPRFDLRQIHSSVTHWLGENETANTVPQGDASGTRLRGVALGIRTADCVPVLLADSSGKAIGAAHAGWRGTSEGIARRAVDLLVEKARISPEDLRASIGPHIGPCCMEVGEEVVEWFHWPEIVVRYPDREKPHVDLGKANRLQLLQAGLGEENIQVSTLCTRCRGDLFHSYRRDGKDAGRMMSVIGLVPET